MVIGPAELIFAGVIVIVLVALALYYGWKELQTLRHVRELDPLAVDERRYRIARAWRRLINSFLMLVLAALLGGSYVLGVEQRAAEAAQAADTKADAVANPEPTPEQREFLGTYSTLWYVILLIFMTIIIFALYDFMAIRRFWLRNYRQIQSDRREMIQREVARIRTQRNGK
jgi:TRAP-type C4-dicarboxylate transport system permease small subunit